MYVGHFAIGVAIKSLAPRVPALPIMVGVGLMDIVDGVLIVLGIDRVSADLKSGPYLYFDLNFIDWDHSLLMALVLAGLWAAVYRRDRQIAAIAAIAVVSHFAADWPVHNSDLALYPYSSIHLGWGLWGRLGTDAWILEGLFSAALLSIAWVVCAKRQVSLTRPAAFAALLFVQLSPWTSPMRWAATLAEPAAHIVHGIFVTLGFLVPSLIFTWLINRAEARAQSLSEPGVA